MDSSEEWVGRLGFGRLAAAIAFVAECLALAAPGAGQKVALPIPEGVLPLEKPADNPLTAAKVTLGRQRAGVALAAAKY